MKLDDIRLGLRVDDVVRTYGLKIRRAGSEYRLRECPKCHQTSHREAIAINVESGSWLHHGCERSAGGVCSGSLLDLVAACEGLDPHNDFKRVMDRAAAIVGNDPITDEERANRLLAATARAIELAAVERTLRITGRSKAAEYWDSLAWHHSRGVAYLESRQLEAMPCVRFSPEGDIVVAIRDTDGHPISTATRLIEPGDRPKVIALKDCSTRGTMVDSVSEIAHGRDVVLVEGVADAITARLAWPNATVLGANGAGNVAHIASACVQRICLARTRLVLVPHDDAPGIKSMVIAGQIAMSGGLQLDHTLRLVSISGPDLNSSWCAGWRPSE